MARTVLIVDDSRLARMRAVKALTSIHPDWAIVEASDVQAALAAVAAQPVDIALIDLNMPGGTGLELVAGLRRDQPDMPIAIITANVQEDVIARVRQSGATFVPKPLTDEALAAFLSGASLRLRGAGKPAT